ncbi:MAG: tRNA uridine-5-carboxymethylaminomethyl(34) synthesis GTPase MnmE [Acidobacteria bacterium]|nr:tRNA uridine-5-carboxymethylaminomethyl(34) synthesis GTPase MnmE [Acidobacteriota bacterium]MBU4307621.1 tRNA uridine-5-carboxymethylaminomethyl(34) synthesis GTPase MnmE [Acidobacteriota bacterium]MBU4405517.1 tRNA uridine-5-carboxymethylaminomethyl(34) synthesis GTPase MnmE [Acidobacteriota bacterium]MCG2810424.1 tRNA uridine-5-carboxymethylaminomethyl(34) synthesis GTPase MnmE [Candidatus Aminicenantes bacterium]
MDDDAIVALATPPGRAGIAVIRISGSQSESIVRKIIGPLPAELEARRSYHGFIHHETRRIDECLAVIFKAPRSYSGEDMAEISLHSNLFVVEEVIGLICACGARPALPGEFTFRAFKNGKLDLLQAEAVNDLIQANSRAGALMQFNNLEGRLSKTVVALRAALVQAAIQIETRIEFAEDQHIEATETAGDLAAAAGALEKILGQSRFNEILNQGLHVVIAGRVNVGKSSLFNALLLKERSIISALPGTTRDYIQENLVLDGFPFHVTDMAGIRAGSGDDIEKQGMELSLAKIAQADAVLFMVDASLPLAETDMQIYKLLAAKKRLLLANKSDKALADIVKSVKDAFPEETVHLISAKNGDNLDVAVNFMKSLLRQMPEACGQTVVNFRQKILLEKLLEKIKRIEQMQIEGLEATEVVAEEIRQGVSLIGELTGTIAPGDILQGVFAKFCIGK